VQKRYRESRWANVAAFCQAIGISRSLYYELIGRAKWFEQATLRDKLTAMGICGPDQVELCEYRQVEADPIAASPASPNNLPRQPTSFIGRKAELATVKRLLADTTLLTLTGSGGCGKTRLAFEVASALLADFPDGVRVVELAALTDANLVHQAVLAALGRREEPGRSHLETAIAFLKPKRLLLLLDNCEHLMMGCAHLATALMRACPQVKLLATSREPLNIQGETLWRVPALGLPDRVPLPSSDPEVVSALAEFDAIRLFVERAGAVRTDFVLDGQNGPQVAEICRRLDGMPLAIELAAVRVRAMTAGQIDAHLEDRFRLLTGGSRTAMPRQQTLRALIDWSYDLLSEPEKLLLARLSVFVGGWTLEAAEQVCAGAGIADWEVLDLLSSLVDKSLVVFEERATGGRYRLLETIRQYAGDRLLEAGESEAVRMRHGDYFLVLAEEADRHWAGPELDVWLERGTTEHDNLRAALAWCAEAAGGAEPALRLAASLAYFWGMRGYWREGFDCLVRALGRGGVQERTKGRAHALSGAGHLTSGLGDYLAARTLYEESLNISRELGDKGAIAGSLSHLGTVAEYQGDYLAARALYEESLSIGRELGDKRAIAGPLRHLGRLARMQGELLAAQTLLGECLELLRELGDARSIAYVINSLGNLALQQDDYMGARSRFEESLTGFQHLGDNIGVASALLNLGGVCCRQGDYASAQAYLEESLTIPNLSQAREFFANALKMFALIAANTGKAEEAVTLWAATEALREGFGEPLTPGEREQYDRDVAETRQALGDVAFSLAWAKGRALTMEQAIARALGEG
jgi:non-specific serine/threonine protein kinase